jgi:hypothetical protein
VHVAVGLVRARDEDVRVRVAVGARQRDPAAVASDARELEAARVLEDELALEAARAF